MSSELVDGKENVGPGVGGQVEKHTNQTTVGVASGSLFLWQFAELFSSSRSSG